MKEYKLHELDFLQRLWCLLWQIANLPELLQFSFLLLNLTKFYVSSFILFPFVRYNIVISTRWSKVSGRLSQKGKKEISLSSYVFIHFYGLQFCPSRYTLEFRCDVLIILREKSSTLLFLLVTTLSHQRNWKIRESVQDSKISPLVNEYLGIFSTLLHIPQNLMYIIKPLRN